jgi:hypothetical protein
MGIKYKKRDTAMNFTIELGEQSDGMATEIHICSDWETLL